MMKADIQKKTLYVIFFCCTLILSIGISAAAQPSLETITLSPEHPWAQSTVVFNASVASETTVDEVRFILRECNEGMCFSDSFNESMNTIETGLYQVSLVFKHDDATYIEYQVKIKSQDLWYPSDIITLNLSEKPDNGSNGTNGDNGNHQNGDGNGQKTPGFEGILLLIAIPISISIIKRKRYR
ncbi:MAG: hypothetical protein V1726_06670 [Methanobacteriota archaeon]